jgi:hypothetical protein
MNVRLAQSDGAEMRKVLHCLFLVLLTGCRNGPPDLRPANRPEALSVPPAGDARYDSPEYPKQAINMNTDPHKQPNANNGTGPMMGGAGGGFGGAGGPGMVGMGGRGY